MIPQADEHDDATLPGDSDHHGSRHLVHFSSDDEVLVGTVSRFIGSALAAGEAGIIVATTPHLERVAEQLTANGLDVAAVRRQGRFVALDAAETLAQILVHGRPDEGRFAEVIGSVVARAAERHPHVRAFGEMVQLLWAQGRRQAAIRLERLWNELIDQTNLSLLCAYSLSEFRSDTDGRALLKICREHSAVVGTGGDTPLDSPAARRHAATQLHDIAQSDDARLERPDRALDLERRRAQQLQTWLASIVESSDDAIIGKTLDGIVTSWNAGAERLFGYRADEMVGKSITRLFPPERADDLLPILGAVRRGERVDHFETERLRKDGQRIHVSLTVSPIKDPDGRIIGASKIARDVTERKRAEAAKDEFLAMLGHELRNPLAAIQSAIAVAHLDSARRDRALDIARRQALQLRRLVDDLLDVARVTQGKIVLRKERLSLALVVERALESARERLADRGHSLAVSLPADISVEVDPARMEQVLVNLLGNAAKYTPPGGHIDVRAQRVGPEIVLTVRDDGIGISADILPRVFDVFSQGSGDLDRRDGGLGLGLALVKRLVELHGGRVEARSNGCGRGTELTLHLPAPDGPPQQPARGSETSLAVQESRARVLIVDDDADAADSLAMLLEILGHKVETAHDGLVALELIEHTRPQVILVDIGLPGIDGFEVARRARLLPCTESALLVALTGYGREEDKAQSRAAGFDYHLTKPIEIDTLKALVAGRTAAQRTAGTPTMH